VYPNGARTVTARHVPGATLDWEAQLGAWLERFPPGGAGVPEVGEVAYPWWIDFGARGEVRGVGASPEEALIEMKRLASGLTGSTHLDQPSFELCASVRRSAGEMDVFTAEAASLAEIDDLPRIVQAKRAERER
jgi:hypothetical protein